MFNCTTGQVTKENKYIVISELTTQLSSTTWCYNKYPIFCTWAVMSPNDKGVKQKFNIFQGTVWQMAERVKHRLTQMKFHKAIAVPTLLYSTETCGAI